MDPHLFIENYDYCVSMLDLNHDLARKVSRVVGASLFDVNDPNNTKYNNVDNVNTSSTHTVAISRVNIGGSNARSGGNNTNLNSPNKNDGILGKRFEKARTYSYPQPLGDTNRRLSGRSIYVPED